MRREDWAEALAAYIVERQEMPFAWATNDCVRFAADWVERCTGEAVALPKYSATKTGAARALSAAGGMQAAVTSALGEPLEFPQLAHRGDVALMTNEGRKLLGVVLGEFVAAPGVDGLLMLPRADILAAWKVGRG